MKGDTQFLTWITVLMVSFAVMETIRRGEIGGKENASFNLDFCYL